MPKPGERSTKSKKKPGGGPNKVNVAASSPTKKHGAKVAAGGGGKKGSSSSPAKGGGGTRPPKSGVKNSADKYDASSPRNGKKKNTRRPISLPRLLLGSKPQEGRATVN